MTPTGLEAILRQIDLQSLSDEELSSLYALLNAYEANIKFILNGRKHYKTHFPSKEK